MQPKTDNTSTYCRILLLLVAIAAICGRQAHAEPPFELPSPSHLTKLRSAQITTDKGQLVFELFPDDAPWHVANFKYLADRGFYRGKRFHVFQPGFILQAGELNGGPGKRFPYVLPAEFNQHRHEVGTLGMARPPDWSNPSRASSGNQFHILLGRASNMDGNYTVFGKLVAGGDVLERLGRGDGIRDVQVFVEETSQSQAIPLPRPESDSFVLRRDTFTVQN